MALPVAALTHKKAQLELHLAPRLPASAVEPVRYEWTRDDVDRSGDGVYIHLIRAAGDPERPGAEKSQGRGWSFKWKEVGQTAPEAWTERIVELLADTQPRTFNAICVELVGVTADVAFESSLDHALWLLKERGRVEHTISVPIRWRLIRPNKPSNNAELSRRAHALSERDRIRARATSWQSDDEDVRLVLDVIDAHEHAWERAEEGSVELSPSCQRGHIRRRGGPPAPDARKPLCKGCHR